MLAHFISETPLTEQELRQLRRILDRRSPKGK